MQSYQMHVIFKGLVIGLIVNALLSHGAPQFTDVAQSSSAAGCPAIQGDRDFSLEKFHGWWFVGYHFHLDLPPCQATKVTVNSTNSIILEGRMIISSNISFGAVGEGFVPDKQNPGSMLWKWSYDPFLYERVTVIDTDYENYAVLVFCVDLGKITRKAAVLWTRASVAHPFYIQRARKLLRPFFNLPAETKEQNECRRKVDSDNMKLVDLGLLFKETVEQLSTYSNLRLGTFFINK